MRVGVAVVALTMGGCSRKVELPAKPAPAPVVASAPVVTARTAPLVDPAAMKALLVQHHGHPLLVNVFASWCGPCAQELPDLDRFARENPRFKIVGVDIDQTEADAMKFLPKVPTTMSVVRSPLGVDPLFPALGLPADFSESFPKGWEATVPLTFVYDSKGEFATGSVGALTSEALAEIAKTP